MRQIILTLALLLVAAVAIRTHFALCKDPLIEDAYRLQHLTAPDGAKFTEIPTSRTPAWSYRTEWSVVTPLPWNDYVQRIDADIPAEFHATRVARAVTYTRRLASDTQNLIVERTAVGPPLRVHVTFISRAD